MEKSTANNNSGLKPSPNILVSCRNKKGENNALAVGYCCNCSYDPPMLMVGIVPSRYSYDMIREADSFVVNLPAKRNRALFDYLGSHSRRDGDKLTQVGAMLQAAQLIDAPILADCPINFECEIVGSIRTGSHEMFAAKILMVHADAALVSEKGEIDYGAVDLL